MPTPWFGLGGSVGPGAGVARKSWALAKGGKWVLQCPASRRKWEGHLSTSVSRLSQHAPRANDKRAELSARVVRTTRREGLNVTAVAHPPTSHLTPSNPRPLSLPSCIHHSHLDPTYPHTTSAHSISDTLSRVHARRPLALAILVHLLLPRHDEPVHSDDTLLALRLQ